MRPLITLLLIATLVGSLRSQPDSSHPITLRSTEIHFGVSSQKFAHIGARQFVLNKLFFEADLGSVPFTRYPHYTYSLGIGIVPEATKYDDGLCYTLLYSYMTEGFLSTEYNYHHLVTANIGYLDQHEEGWSILLRAGAGIFQENSLIVTDDPRQWYAWDHNLYPWVNLEFSLGYAF